MTINSGETRNEQGVQTYIHIIEEILDIIGKPYDKREKFELQFKVPINYYKIILLSDYIEDNE